MGTTKAHVYQQTLGFTKNIPGTKTISQQTYGFTRKYIHQYQNNLSTDLWLYLTGEQNKRNIQNTKFKSDTSDIRFLTVRMSGGVLVV